jgi:hypothetical protein
MLATNPTLRDALATGFTIPECNMVLGRTAVLWRSNNDRQ